MKTLKSILVIIVLVFATTIMQAQEIFDAIKANDLAKVKALIEKNASLISLKDASGNTPLHQAAIIGSIELVKYFLLKGADINEVNLRQDTPLFESILNEKMEVSKLLIEEGCDIFKKDDHGYTALHFAAMRNQYEIVTILIEKGADLNSKNIQGFTPLNLICRSSRDNSEVARLLIEKGADINLKDNLNNTPLNMAGVYGHPNVINLLLDHQADFDTKGELARYMIIRAADLGLDRFFDVVAQKFGNSLFNNDEENKRIVSSALAGGSIEIVNKLVSKNIPMSFDPDIRGWTPLHHAVQRNKRGILAYMVDKGADINARTNDGKSPYNIAEENGQKELLKEILRLGGNSIPQIFPALKGPYFGQDPPGNILKPFAPGIIEIDHTSISFSPDGLEMAWGTGTSIMMSRVVNGQWTKPDYPSFSGKNEISFYDDVPFFAPDNQRLFFTSRRPLGSANALKENIWHVERKGNGWSEPVPLGDDVNGQGLHWQISVSRSGALYFAGTRSDSHGSSDIYVSRNVEGRFLSPENMGPPVNSKEGESQPFLSPDESYILFVRVIERRPIPHVSYKSKNGKWQQPVSLEKYIGKTGCLIVSPDGKYLFTQNGFWISAEFIEELRPKE